MDTSTAAFQIGLAVFSSAAGAVASNYVLPGRASPPKYDLTGARIDASGGQVTIGDNSLVVRHTSRVYITVAATRAMARGTRAAKPRPRRASEQVGRAASSSGGDDVSFMFALAVGAMVATAAVVLVYARNLEAITDVIRLVATAALAFSLSAVTNAAVRKVRLDRRLTIQLIVTTGLALGALFALSWLSDPPEMANRAGFEHLMEDASTLTVNDVISGFDSRLVQAVFLQVVGVVLLATSLVFIVVHALGIFAVAGFAARAEANPQYVPGWLRVRLMSAFGGPTSSFWLALVAAILAGALLYGIAGRYIPPLQSGVSDPTTIAPAQTGQP